MIAHFRHPRNMAEEQAQLSGIATQDIILSFSNYLCDLVRENEADIHTTTLKSLETNIQI